jgi:hypothetical protein
MATNGPSHIAVRRPLRANLDRLEGVVAIEPATPARTRDASGLLKKERTL